MSLFWYALAGLGLHQTVVGLRELGERHALFAQAHESAALRGKPALVVGMPRYPWEYACSPSVTLDLDPAVLTDCPLSGVVADIRAIPYPDSAFGAALVSHVLEHLASIDDVALAWRELWRVADEVLVAYPQKDFIVNWLAEGHHLWVTPVSPPVLDVEERGGLGRRGLVYPNGAIGFIPVAIGG